MTQNQSKKSSQSTMIALVESERKFFKPTQQPPSILQDMKDEDEDLVEQDDIELGEDVLNLDIDSFRSSPIQGEQKPLSQENVSVVKFNDKNMIKLHFEGVGQKISRKQTMYKGGYTSKTWRKSALVIVYIISKFVQSLQQQSDTFKFRMLSQKVFQLINDRSSDFDFYLLTKQIKGNISTLGYFYRRFSGFCVKHTPIQYLNALEPDGYGKIFWDTFTMGITILNIFYIPTKLAFDIRLQENSFSYFLLDQLPSWVFLLDCFLNFNTAYYDEGKINSNRKSIMIHYIQGDFILDSIVITVFFISKFQIPYIDFILLLRITRVSRMFENVEEALNLRERFATIIDLIKLIYLVVFVGHFCACAWYYLAFYENGNSWLVARHLTDASISTKYIQSLYWSVITLLTIGYGDIAPVTDIEMLFVIIMTLITCGVFGYAINSIGSIFKEMEQKKGKLRNQMATINSHMRKNNINKKLQLKVRKYFEYYFQRNDDEEEKVNRLMNDLAPDLKNDVLIDMYKKTLLNSKLLRENLSDQCLNKLCLCVKEQRLSPDEMIFEKGKQINRLYFIVNGKVKICFEEKHPDQATEIQSMRIRHFKEGYVLGEKHFLMRTEMNYQAQAAVFSRIAYISYEDFIACTQSFPNVYEKICLLKDKIDFNELFKKVFTVCEICKSNHAFNKCPYPFFQCNRSKILYVENKLKPQERKKFNRRNKQPKNEISILQQAGLAICLNENFLNEDELNDEYLAQLGFGGGQTIDTQQNQYEDDLFEIEMNQSPKHHSTNHPYFHLDTMTGVAEIDKIMPSEKVLRFDNFPQSSEQRDHGLKSPGTSTQTPKKGILKKQTHSQHQNLNFEHQSSEVYSEVASIRKITDTLNISQNLQRHQKLTIKYDRVSQLLKQFVSSKDIKSDRIIESPSINNSQNMSLNLIKKKQQSIENQSSIELAAISISNQQLDLTPNQFIKNYIKYEAINDFDMNKAYDIYYPEYNLEVVLSRMNKLRKNYQNNSIHQNHSKRSKEIENLVKNKLITNYFHQKRFNSQKQSMNQGET